MAKPKTFAPAEPTDETGQSRSARVQITLPTLQFGYRGRPVSYRDGRIYVDGRPSTRRREQ